MTEEITKVVSLEDLEKLQTQYNELSSAYNELLKKVQSAEEREEAYTKMQKRIERIEKGQAVHKGMDSEFEKAAPQRGYMRSVLAAAYGIDPRA